jgi:DNA repair protein RadD
MLKLRPYQSEAVQGVYDYWTQGKGKNPLVVAPTGAGKSAIMAQIVNDVIGFNGRVLMLAHVKELLEQNGKALINLGCKAPIGFYSASLGQKDLSKPVTIAGIQSIWQKATDFFPPPDVVIIDEAHMLPQKTTTRYGAFIKDLLLCNPKIKIIGMTATPYRLDCGLLYEGQGAIFDGVAYDIPVSLLIAQGYLAPLVSRAGADKIDLSNVGKRGGEFIDSELAIAASQPELVKATVNEIVTLGELRRSWLVFASGVSHAHLLQEEFENHGVSVATVTGNDGKTERAKKIADYKAGKLRCLINVDVLTTGFDAPETDLVAIVRATESTSLYVQMAGRGTRIAQGKVDCLLLDYGGNVVRHGCFDAVQPKLKGGGGDGEAPAKECPKCNSVIFAGLRVCPACNHEFPAPELNHAHKSHSGAVLQSQIKSEWIDIYSVEYSRHKKPGKPDSVRVTYSGEVVRVSEWLCPDHGGFATEKFHDRLKILDPACALDQYAYYNTDTAMQLCNEWVKPSRILVKPNGKYHDIVKLDYAHDAMEPEKKEDFIDDEIPF